MKGIIYLKIMRDLTVFHLQKKNMKNYEFKHFIVVTAY